jgi:hypothetical protein
MVDRLSSVIDIELLLSAPLACGSLMEFISRKHIIAPTAVLPVIAVTTKHDSCHKCAQSDNSTNLDVFAHEYWALTQVESKVLGFSVVLDEIPDFPANER